MSIPERNAVVMEIAEIAGDLQQRAFDYDVVWPRYRDDAASSRSGSGPTPGRAFELLKRSSQSSTTRLAVLARQLLSADHPPQ